MLLRSAHDCSDGGLAVAIAESGFSSLSRNAVGAEIELKGGGLTAEALLFGESPSRIVISFAAEHQDKIRASVGDCPFEMIGKISGDKLEIQIDGNDSVLAPIAELEKAWKTSLERDLT